MRLSALFIKKEGVTGPVAVYVHAGPQAMYADIKNICAGINGGSGQQCKPYLSVHRQAYNL